VANAAVASVAWWLSYFSSNLNASAQSGEAKEND